MSQDLVKRISFAHIFAINAAAPLELPEARYAVLSSLNSATPKFTFLSGHMKGTPDLIDRLKSYGADFDAYDKEEEGDLIFRMKKSSYTHHHKNLSDILIEVDGVDGPENELRQELTQENKILDSIDDMTYLWSRPIELEMKSTRKTSDGHESNYFFRLHGIVPTEEQAAQFFKYAEKNPHVLGLLTVDQLRENNYNGVKLVAGNMVPYILEEQAKL